MANTATPGNGFMVVTQVIPSATEGQHAAGPGPGVATVRVPNVGVHNVHVPTVGVPYVEVHNVPFVTPVSNSTTAPAPNPLQVFRRSKPTALGTVQIMIGVVCFLMSTVLSIEELPFSIYSGITYWGPTFYIISGSLTVAAEKHLTSCLVKGSLGMNVCSAVFAGLAIILLLMDFAVDLEFYDCDCYLLDDCSCEVNRQLMTRTCGTSGVLLVLSGLQLIISICISAFGCRATCCYKPVVSVGAANHEACCSMTKTFQPHSRQQDVLYIAVNVNNSPMDNPPAYSPSAD